MSDLKIDITNTDDKIIAKAARDVALKFDMWGTVRPQIIAFVLGAVFISALDYGDVWVCVGSCDALYEVPQ